MWKLTWLLTKPQEWAVEGVLACSVLSKSSKLVPPEHSDGTGDEIKIPLRDFVVQFFSTLNSRQMDLSVCCRRDSRDPSLHFLMGTSCFPIAQEYQ